MLITVCLSSELRLQIASSVQPTGQNPQNFAIIPDRENDQPKRLIDYKILAIHVLLID